MAVRCTKAGQCGREDCPHAHDHEPIDGLCEDERIRLCKLIEPWRYVRCLPIKLVPA